MSKVLRGVAPGTAGLRVAARRTWFETPHRLSGAAVDGTGRPVVGARVECRPAGFVAPSRRQTTSQKGRFCLMGLRPGRWRLRVSGPVQGAGSVEAEYLDGQEDIRVVLE
jgi:hypothetical protein